MIKKQSHSQLNIYHKKFYSKLDINVNLSPNLKFFSKEISFNNQETLSSS